MVAGLSLFWSGVGTELEEWEDGAGAVWIAFVFSMIILSGTVPVRTTLVRNLDNQEEAEQS